MPDPTEMVLTGTFAMALGVFVIFALFRAVGGRKPVDLARGDSDGADEARPSDPSREVTVSPPELPVGKVPVWFYRPLDVFGVAFVFLVFAVLVLASLRSPQETAVQLDPKVLLINIGFQFVMAGVVAVLVVMRVGWVSWLGLRWASWPWVFLIAPCTVFFMWLVFGGLQVSGYVKWMESLGVETVQDTVKLLQDSEDPLVLGLMAFAAVFVAPICEEIVFRGYFYPVLKKFAGVWPAAVCSAMVFASAHGSLTALLPLLIFGGVLVFLYEKTGSIWAPIAVHFSFNGATVIVQMAARYFHIPLDAAP